MIVLRGGQVYDPANGVDGRVGDLWIAGRRIAQPPQDPSTATVIDARGWIIAPGAVEIHAHLGGAPLALARRFCLGERAAPARRFPSPTEIAAAYLRMGYTTLMDAAMPPQAAWHTHTDLQNMGSVERGAYVLAGDHQLILQAASQNSDEALQAALAWLLKASKAYAIKMANPGVAALWRNRGSLSSLDDEIYPRLTQRKLIQSAAAAAVALGLPHPLHLHASNLGRPGNWQSFLETVKTLENLRAHLCHIQFYLYGKEDGLSSAVERVVEDLALSTNLTFDVGQIAFGPVTALSADLELIDWLHSLDKGAWTYQLWEGEGAVAAMPSRFQPENPSGAVQWATGLELLLRFPDPTRLFLTVDYPNGGSFTAYPQIIGWLMQREERRQMLKQIHRAASVRSGLAAIEREYSLGEIIAMTSWGPARALGLTDRGHLAAGALADLRCYKLQPDPAAMFSCPVLVIKNGQVVSREGRLVAAPPGDTLVVSPQQARDIDKRLLRSFFDGITITQDQYAGSDRKEMGNFQVVPCKSTV